jgi:hypothetical protein
MTQMIASNGRPTVQLQEVGKFTAKPASELKVGDVMVWNYGSTSTVLTIRHQGKSVYLTQRDESGKEYPERRFLGTRLIACVGAWE